MKPWQNILLGILLGLFFAGVILLFILPQRGTPIPLVTVTPQPGSEQTPTTDTIKVELAGAVMQAGVYDFPKGIHLIEAVELAGGFAPEADLDKLNLAMVLKDGQKVRVLAAGAEGGNSGDEGLSAPININTANLAQLETLPGVGSQKAQSILNYRNDHGAFLKIEDLMEVPGIGETIFEGLKTFVTVEN